MGLFKEGSWWWSFFNMKCPRCRKGDLFKTETFSFQKPFEMPDSCDECGQTYMPEPGFYYGSMFLSYIFFGWFCVIFGLIAVFLLDWSVNKTFAILIFISIILFVWIFRIFRSLWIHLMVKHKENYISKRSSKDGN